VIGDRPAHDAAGPGVEHHGQIELAFAGRVLGDVADPEPIRAGHLEAAVHQVVAGDGGRVALGAALGSPASIHTLQAGLAHEPLDPLAGNPDTSAEAQLGVHPRTAIGAPGLAVDLGDRAAQLDVLPGPMRRIELTGAPLIKTGGRHLHRTAGRRDRQIRATLGDEGEHHFGSTFSRAK
jgi:hypothetical protein